MRRLCTRTILPTPLHQVFGHPLRVVATVFGLWSQSLCSAATGIPNFQPYVLAFVDMDEGFGLASEIFEADLDTL